MMIDVEYVVTISFILLILYVEIFTNRYEEFFFQNLYISILKNCCIN